jgi:hypothetical protein
MTLARINLQLKGFDDMLEQIKKAGGDVNQAAESCIRESAKIMHDELTAEAQSSGMDSGLVGRMPPPEIIVNGNTYKAKVGYKMGNYNPDDPADGFKAAFWNFGTPNRQTSDDKQHVRINGRWVTLGRSRGAIAEHGYIARAKKSAAPKIKKAQKKTLQEILGRLSG